ncbi:MAG: hypothetical protein WJU30_00572 [Candidatus Phytoplasma pruni]
MFFKKKRKKKEKNQKKKERKEKYIYIYITKNFLKNVFSLKLNIYINFMIFTSTFTSHF